MHGYSWNIIWEYSPEFHRELFPNIPGIYHENFPRIRRTYICLLGVFQQNSPNSEENTWAGTCAVFLWNFYFFSFLTKRLPTTVSEIRRVLFLSILFCLFGSIYFAPSQMFNVEISWNLEKILQTVSQLCMSWSFLSSPGSFW